MDLATYVRALTRLCVLVSLLVAGSLHAETTVEQKLQSALEGFLADNFWVPGATVALDSEQLGLHWSGGAGVGNTDTKAPISADQPVRLASTTKTYVAAAILRLYEQGKLGLNDNLDQRLSKTSLKTLGRGGYKTGVITVRQLLTHTAGLYDHALSQEYFEAITATPQHNWTREEQVSFAVDYGEPLGQPGERYYYSDTGYVLLGEMIERTTGKPLGPAVRELLRLDHLGLNATWWEIMEPAPEGVAPRAHQYLMGMDATGFHASLDLFGGGGLIANMPDLARFFEALFEGEVFDNQETLNTMLTTILPDTGGPASVDGEGNTYQYCMGVHATEHKNVTIYGHGGFWGITGAYIPHLDLAIGINVTEPRPRPMNTRLMRAMLDVVLEHYQVMTSGGH